MTEPRPRIHTGSVVGGCVLGVLTTWVSTAVITLMQYASGASESALNLAIALLLVPAVSLIMLVHPKSRYAGAGLMLGFAIGSVTGAGICRAFVFTAAG